MKQVHFNSYAPGWLEGRCSPFLHPSRRASRYFCGQTWHQGQKPLGSQAFTGLILLPINTMLVRTNPLCKIRQWFCTFSCNHFTLEANPTWTIGSAVPQKEIKGDDRLTCSSRRTVWTDWWFHPPLCWTSPQLLLVPARGSLRRSPASASSHLSNRNALWNETLWKNLKIKVLEIIGGDGGGEGGVVGGDVYLWTAPGLAYTQCLVEFCRLCGKFLNISEHGAYYIQGSLRKHLSWSVVTDLILSCGHVLWTWTSHRGQNLLVSKKATMQVLQTAEAKSNFR